MIRGLIRPIRERWAWRQLDRALTRWRAAGTRAPLWWRDDDARAPTDQLVRLLALSRRHHVPVTLAVIPDGDLSALFAALAEHPQVTIAQHGTDHEERTVIAGRRAEWTPKAKPSRIRRRIMEGWDRLAHHPQARPIYVPPWNHATPNLLAALEDTPHEVISLFGSDRVETSLDIVNASVDLMQWRPPAFRGTLPVLGRLTRLLHARLAEETREPIGLLTHHFNHDEATWTFLERLLSRLIASGAVAWVSPVDVRQAA